MSLTQEDLTHLRKVSKKRISSSIFTYALMLTALFAFTAGNFHLAQKYAGSEVSSNEWLKKKAQSRPEFCSSKCYLVQERSATGAVTACLFLFGLIYFAERTASIKREKRYSAHILEQIDRSS